MKAYLWSVEYDVISAMRFTRTEQVVTEVLEPSAAEAVFLNGLDEEEKKVFDFIRKIEFNNEIIR